VAQGVGFEGRRRLVQELPLRPKDPVGHGTVDGISSSYQYYMERDCHVLMRKYSCRCHACRRVARRTAGALGASFKVSGCERTGRCYEWTKKTCGPKSGNDVTSAVNKRTQKRGHELAASGDLAVGSCFLVECFDDKEDGMWLGKAVNSVDLGGADLAYIFSTNSTPTKKNSADSGPLFKPSSARYLPPNGNQIARFAGTCQATGAN